MFPSKPQATPQPACPKAVPFPKRTWPFEPSARDSKTSSQSGRQHQVPCSWNSIPTVAGHCWLWAPNRFFASPMLVFASPMQLLRQLSIFEIDLQQNKLVKSCPAPAASDANASKVNGHVQPSKRRCSSLVKPQIVSEKRPTKTNKNLEIPGG